MFEIWGLNTRHHNQKSCSKNEILEIGNEEMKVFNKSYRYIK